MNIKARLTIYFTVLFGALVLAISAGAYLFVREEVYSKLDATLQVAAGATAMSAEHEIAEHSHQAAGEADLRSVLAGAGITALQDTQIVVRDGHRVAAFKGAGRDWDLQKLSDANLKSGNTYAGVRIAAYNLPIDRFHTTYTIYAGRSVAPALAKLSRIRISLLLIVPLGLLIAGLAGFVMADRSLRPLRELTVTVDAVSSSDLSARVRLQSRFDEIGVLGERFNALLDRLEQAFTLQRRFMADASHQIRTPVTIALSAVQVVTSDPESKLSDHQSLGKLIERQMLQLRSIVDDMFFLSRSDVNSSSVELRPLFLEEAVDLAVREARVLRGDRKRRLVFEPKQEARCLGDPDLLRQAIVIVLDNALRCSPDDGVIEVTLHRTGNSWVCAIADEGPGIPPEYQERVFERFFRVNSTEPAKTGAGLGLAIAKSILEKHGGSICVAESRPGRTVFELAVPALAAEDTQTHHANSLAVRT